jgi:hypothetical protein
MLRVLFVVMTFPALLLGSLMSAWQAHDCFKHAESRAAERVHAAKTVTELGLLAEAQFLRDGTMPSERQLNCREPCTSGYFVARTVSVDQRGVITAKFEKMGVPFTPTSQFTATWDSSSRRVESLWLSHRWAWWIMGVGWSLLGVLMLIAHWWADVLHATVRVFSRVAHAIRAK